MKPLTATPLVLIFHALLCINLPIFGATSQAPSPDPTSRGFINLPVAPLWNSSKAEHVYGFPDIKPNKKGTLTLSQDSLAFSGKSGNTSIPRSSVTAVSAGNQRVEIWGIGGRILRMTIPNGGGLAAATFMHHRVDMLTVEFTDSHGSKRGAVFFLPAKEADRALQSFSLSSPNLPSPSPSSLVPVVLPLQKTSEIVCQKGPVVPGSVLVAAPDWDNTAVPAAYRSLVYEHVVDRLRRTKSVGHVYREGESTPEGGCPQYIVHLSVTAFKPGSSVQRAFLGPVGFFVGTTQMKFDVTIADTTGTLKVDQQITATIRGESESTNVADHVAKNIAKRYSSVLKNANKSDTPKATYRAS